MRPREVYHPTPSIVPWLHVRFAEKTSKTLDSGRIGFYAEPRRRIDSNDAHVRAVETRMGITALSEQVAIRRATAANMHVFEEDRNISRSLAIVICEEAAVAHAGVMLRHDRASSGIWQHAEQRTG